MTRNWLFEIDLSYKTHTLDLNSVQKFFGFDINDFHSARCLKITEKVSFNIASEASYVYILSGQKLIKSAKNGQFGEFLKN